MTALARKPMTPAQRAMADKPSEKTIARVTAAYLSQDAVKHHEFDFRGYTIRIYDSPYTAGEFLACADRPPGPGGIPPAALSHEAKTLDAARAWVRALPR